MPSASVSTSAPAAPFRAAVLVGLAQVADAPTDEHVAAVVALVHDARRLGVGFDRWAAQNRVFELWRRSPEARRAIAPLATTLGFAVPMKDSA